MYKARNQVPLVALNPNGFHYKPPSYESTQLNMVVNAWYSSSYKTSTSMKHMGRIDCFFNVIIRLSGLGKNGPLKAFTEM